MGNIKIKAVVDLENRIKERSDVLNVIAKVNLDTINISQVRVKVPSPRCTDGMEWIGAYSQKYLILAIKSLKQEVIDRAEELEMQDYQHDLAFAKECSVGLLTDIVTLQNLAE